MNLKHLILPIGLIVALSACSDFFETSLELEAPAYDKTLVLDCQVKSGQDTVLIRVSRNFGILENIKYQAEAEINDATVQLNINGLTNNASKLVDATDYNYRIILNSKLKPGDQLEIKAAHPTYPSVTSSATLLPFCEVISAGFTENGGLDNSGDKRSKITIKIKDKPGKNYYAIQVHAPNSNGRIRPTFISSIDPGLKEAFGNNILVLTDEGFDGKEKILDILMYPIAADHAKGNLKVVWYDINESYYHFSRSLLEFDRTKDNPFANPVSVISNINNGTGIFAAHTYQEVDVK
ncbi:MAG: DUF4249 domain-containing protein [Saprospiraceae bacterium]